MMTFPESEACCSEDSPPSKRLKLDEPVRASASASSSEEDGLLKFCDDIILEILCHTKPIDRLALSQCCRRLYQIACDKTLWEHVSLDVSDEEIRKIVQFLLPSTKSIVTKGPWIPPLQNSEDNDQLGVAEQRDIVGLEKEPPTISAKTLELISEKCTSLSTFVFQNHVFDCNDIKFNMLWEKLPGSLQELTLNTCHLSNFDRQKAFFSGISEDLPNLKKLDLSGCEWFQPHSFLALSKCKSLEVLRLAGCLLSDFVPYVSLGTRFGFQALTVLDLRRTWVSDREVSCFDKTTTLRELYLESPGGARGPHLISDLAVTAFGGSVADWNNMGYVVMFTEYFEDKKPSSLCVIELCNYKAVTGTSLRHCVSCLKDLKRLNIKGTSCSLAEVSIFKAERPDVVVISDFDCELAEDNRDQDDNT